MVPSGARALRLGSGQLQFSGFEGRIPLWETQVHGRGLSDIAEADMARLDLEATLVVKRLGHLWWAGASGAARVPESCRRHGAGAKWGPGAGLTYSL